MAQQGPSLFKRFLKALGICALFLAGFAAGMLVFTPWDQVWTMALEKAAPYTEKVNLKYAGVSDAWPLGFTLDKVSAQVPGLRSPVAMDKLTITLGLTPLVSLTINTGPELVVNAHRNRRVDISGGLDLGRVVSVPGMGGAVYVQADVLLDKHDFFPKSGRADLASESIHLPGGISGGDVYLAAELADNVVQILNFTAAKPLPVKAKGSLELDRSDLSSSFFRVSGEATLGDTARPFERSGTLRDSL